MKYLLMIYASESEENAMPPDEMGKVMQAYGAYTEALIAAGALQAGERLRPVTDATSVRVRGADAVAVRADAPGHRRARRDVVARPALRSGGAAGDRAAGASR